MSRISAIGLYIVLCMTVLLFHQPAAGCQVDEFYITNQGHLAGATPDNLIKAEKTAHLDSMIKAGEIIRLTSGTKVQALERSLEHQMIKIKFPDTEVPYWVREDALQRIKGN